MLSIEKTHRACQTGIMSCIGPRKKVAPEQSGQHQAGPVAESVLSINELPEESPESQYFKRTFHVDEGLLEHFSCAVEQGMSILYHGRMYISREHLAFRSEVLGVTNLVLPMRDIEDLSTSSHWVINPAVLVTLKPDRHMNGDRPRITCGTPTSVDSEGRASYLFASFWDRNGTYELLRHVWSQRWAAFLPAPAATTPTGKEEAATTAGAAGAAEGAEAGAGGAGGEAVAELSAEDAKAAERAKSTIVTCDAAEMMPAGGGHFASVTPEDFFSLFYGDRSEFFDLYHKERKDFDVDSDPWRGASLREGLMREVRYRALCNHPMCPRDTAVTETQRALLRGGELLVEVVVQSHDVPYGDRFLVQTEWRVRPEGAGCKLEVACGVVFLSWTVLASRIKVGAVQETGACVMQWIDVATDLVVPREEETEGAGTGGKVGAGAAGAGAEAPTAAAGG